MPLRGRRRPRHRLASRCRRAADRRARRTERCRQDDDVRGALGPPPSPSRVACMLAGVDVTRASPQQRARLGLAAHLPASRALRRAHGAGAPRDRAPRAPAAATASSGATCSGSASRALAGRRRRRRRSCSISSGWVTSPSGPSSSCRSGPAGSSRSAARWRPSRRVVLLDEPTSGLDVARDGAARRPRCARCATSGTSRSSSSSTTSSWCSTTGRCDHRARLRQGHRRGHPRR